MLSIPLLTGMIERETADAIDLSNSTTIEIQTASFRTVRGYTIVAALADELAFWRSDESANPGLVFEPDLSGGRQERAGGDRSLGGWINPHIGCGHKTKGDTMLDTVTTPRTELRAAIARRDAAAQGEIDATKAAVRAKQLLDDAEQNVAMLSGVDDKIAKHRADEIKAWATNGGQRPSGALPSHLASKKAFKADAEAKFTAARSAHGVLSNELVAAPGHLQRQQVAVQRAAGAVLSAEAPSLIEELHQARRTAWALEYKLKSLSAVRFTEVDGRSVLIQMPAATFAALNETAPPMLAINAPKPYTIALAGWQRYLQALSDNPDSTLE